MTIYIELLIIGILVIMLVTWAVWYNLSLAWLKWRYKPENDKGRPREDNRKGNGTENPTPIPAGIPQPEGRELLQKPKPTNVGENSSGNRKVSFFRRIRRK